MGFDPLKLIQDHQLGLWRYLRALGCAREVADDLAQETFLIVLQRPFQDYSEVATRAYLRKVAYNLLVTQQRRAGRVVAVENIEQYERDWNRWAGDGDGEDALRALRGCLKVLGPRALHALKMRFEERRSRQEIADALQMTEHGAKNLMQRAKKKLRDCVEGKISESADA
ncbi:MAG: sigma-70 family RNA polymerase sigma factor [Planctomycetes bacterium]|nr:sigma-70 family RNA polymerase sigma factor [Planctomycetota bacterium]